VSARILLNVDLGELPDEPEALYECAHVANVACGGHAGDDDSISARSTSAPCTAPPSAPTLRIPTAKVSAAGASR
jgi:hypothetical protein